MKGTQKNSIELFFLVLALCMSCGSPPTPEPPFIVVRTFYKTAAGADLLNPGTPNSYKESEILVISQVEKDGVITDFNYDEVAFGGVVVDDITGFSCLQLAVPTNWGKNPIRTLIKLNQNDTDTVTYTYLPSRFKNLPDKIFYNNKMVWTVADIQSNESYPPITIIK